MLVKVKFKGFAGKLCPDDYVVDARTPFEAIRAVALQLKDKLKRPNGHKFSFFAKGYKTKDSLYSSLKDDVLELYPVFMPAGGGKYSGVLTMLAIVAVIFLCVLTFGGGLAAVGGFFSGVGAGGTLAGGATLSAGSYWAMSVAVALTVSAACTAVSIALTDEPDKPDANSSEQRYSFSLNGNTTTSGTTIPVLYGRYKTYGQLLSWATQADSPFKVTSLITKLDEEEGEGERLFLIGGMLTQMKLSQVYIFPSIDVGSLLLYENIDFSIGTLKNTSGKIGSEESKIKVLFNYGTEEKEYVFSEKVNFLTKDYYMYTNEDEQFPSVLLSPNQKLEDIVLGFTTLDVSSKKIVNFTRLSDNRLDLSLSDGSKSSFEIIDNMHKTYIYRG